MLDYWISFATSVDATPNDGKGSARTNWTEYKTATPGLLELTSTKPVTGLSYVQDNYRAEGIQLILDNQAAFGNR
jgi:hypothetical protein